MHYQRALMRWCFAPLAISCFALSAHAVDTDGDGVDDSVDNCSTVANPDQIDSNGDGFGNRCDADLNNDLVVNFSDLGLLRLVFFTNDEDADLNSDGVVNVTDLGVMRAAFFQPPGPGATGSPTTWTNDIQPIFEELCTPCHTGLGLGGHDLGTDYSAAPLAAVNPLCDGLTKGACTIVRIQSGQMPPNRGCTGDPAIDAADPDCLDQAEQSLVQDWIDAGIPE
ncbi:MAG: thrombospondin type 3 repeat-containing protein [Gammaproteobacteria bacterium]